MCVENGTLEVCWWWRVGRLGMMCSWGELGLDGIDLTSNTGFGWHWEVWALCLIELHCDNYNISSHIQNCCVTGYLRMVTLRTSWEFYKWYFGFSYLSRRLDLTTTKFLWPEQCCKNLCIFCYFRLTWGNRNVPLARATLTIPLYFLQRCQGRPLRSGNLKLPEIQRNW